ncbi:MAG: energy transducer TonB [candidate division Zixibacteria bacterium]|nr:energy transducer TonB [candidate division Zixibacteria bacterium]
MKKTCRILLLTFALAVLFTALSETGNTQEVKKDLPSETEFVPLEIYPEMIYQETPVYPEKAESAKIEGMVYIKALIDSEGKVVEAKVGKSSGHDLLDKAAVAAAYKCKFKPGIQKGEPVASWVTYKVDFKLGECDETEK